MTAFPLILAFNLAEIGVGKLNVAFKPTLQLSFGGFLIPKCPHPASENDTNLRNLKSMDPVFIRVGAVGMIFAQIKLPLNSVVRMTRAVFAADCGGIAPEVIRHLSR